MVDAHNQFDVIVVDPPWSYGTKTEAKTVRYQTQLAAQQYNVIGSVKGKEVNRKSGDGIEQIAASVPLSDFAAPVSSLYLWATNPKLPFAFDLMKLWGFDYKTTLTWLKTTQDGRPLNGGLGWFYRGATEHVLFGTRGGYGIPAALRKSNVIMAPRTGHSAKPASFYDLVESVSPQQQRLDVFARRHRVGWSVWGDEIDD